MAQAMKSDAKLLHIRMLDGDALKKLCTEPNSSKFAVDAHNRAIEEIGDLSELPKLCSLDLSFNRLKVVQNLNTAKELRELKLYNNKLTTTNGLRANSNLEGVFLNENQIEAISADLLALAKLKSLWLKGNRIERVENLRSCRLLVFLDLSRNRLAGIASEGLETLTSLETLNLSDNRISAIGSLSHLTKLEDLNLGNNQLTTLDGQFPPNLTTLRVNGNRISDLRSLAGTLASLNELYIQDNVLGDLEPIASRFPELESLDVRNNRIRSAAQVAVLSTCKILQDIWIIGNPCCLSSSYLVDIFTALPELKTLDNLTDAQLQSHIEGLKSGAISPRAVLPTARPHTPSSYRPGTASRPGSSSSGVGARPITPSGRPGTPDAAAPVFHQPSARIGNLMKLVSPSEIEKTKTEVCERLQKMKDMLHRVGTESQIATGKSSDNNAHLSEPLVQQQRAAFPAAPTAFRGDPRMIERRIEQQSTEEIPVATTLSTSRDHVRGKGPTGKHHPLLGSSSGLPSPPVSEPATKPQAKARKAGVDAGTDPIDSFLSGNNVDWLATPRSDRRTLGHEIETQTSLPPPPVFTLGSENEPETHSLSEKGQPTEPPFDGDLIELEMKQFLMQYVANKDRNDESLSGENQDGHDEPEADPKRMESPRIDPIKIAEQRRPPNPQSRQGYRTFRTPPSRPNSSSAL